MESAQSQTQQTQEDSFPDFLKKLYKTKPGYDAWKSIFGNKIQEKIDIFIIKYSSQLEVDEEKGKLIAKVIDRDGNQSISFEEFMAFVDFYSNYYDEKGSHLKKNDQFFKKLQDDDAKFQTQQPMIQGKILYVDGTIYEGQIEGKRHGHGKLVQGSHYVYEGEFKDDMKWGYGVQTQSSCKYEGNWENNQKNGHGKQTFFDGSIYEGDFKDNVPHGKGKLLSEDGIIYEGNFVEGYMNEGRIYYKNGDMYEGQTRDTRFKNGRGKLYKLVSEGNFVNDEFTNIFKYLSVQDKENLLKEQDKINTLQIELSSAEGHDSKLLANIKNLTSLSIQFTTSQNPHDNKELTLQLLENIHLDSIKNLQELHIYIPNEEMTKIPLQDFRDLFKVVRKFANVTILDLSLPCWGAGNLDVDGTIIDQLVETYQNFKHLKGLKLDLHQWGYQNTNLKNDQVIAIIKGLDILTEQITSLSLDLGRWGVDTYESYQYISDETLEKMTNLLSDKKQLQELSLNLRSWAYNSQKITDEGVNKLFEGISKLDKLKKLDLYLRGLGYDNKVTQASVDSLASCVSKLINLERITLNLEICYNFNNINNLKAAIGDLPKIIYQNIIQ